jgi:LuxR family maltose regulon positive regulatory protein
MKDLHFTRTEIKEYAKNQFNIILNPYEVKQLKEKTEGWILGLKGALMIYQKTESSERLKQGLVAQEFKDLFFNEIIFKQEKTLQTALFISSLFERFCNPMLNFILNEGYENNLPVKKIIQEFERNNFFIISLDNQNEWYRFHHQFQVVLKEYLLEHISDSEVIKYQKAGSSWLVNKGYYEEGIERAVNTKDSSFALDQFVRLKYKLLNSDQYNRLKYLLEIFPVSWQDKYPELVSTKGLLLEIQGKYNAIPAILNHFEQITAQANIAEAEMKEYLYLKGMVLYVAGKYHESFKSFEKCISIDITDSDYIHTLALSSMSFAMNNLIHKDKAFQILNTYLDSLSNRKHFARGRIYAAKAFLYSYNGELNETEKLLPHIINSSSNHEHYITLSYGFYLKIMLYYCRNKFEDCIETFKTSYDNRFRMQSSYFLGIWGIKALFHLKRNEPGLLDKTLREIDEFVFLVKDHSIDHLHKCFLTEIPLQRGDNQRARDIAKNTDFSIYLPSLFFYFPQFTLLKLLLQLDDPESLQQYKKISEKFEVNAQETNHKIFDINLNLLKAKENFRSGHEQKAIGYLMNALEITSSENIIMIYSDYGDEIYELIEKLTDVIRDQDHEKSIIQLLKKIKGKSLSQEKASLKLDVELNGRDIKILRMVSRGHKNIEIAQSMFLSPESIKKYMYEIFQKLQVDNRIKAVIKANKLE